MKKWLKIVIALIVVALLFANPMSRSIILFILPLGSGIDDLIEIIAIISAICIFIIGTINDKKKIEDDKKFKEKNKTIDLRNKNYDENRRN